MAKNLTSTFVCALLGLAFSIHAQALPLPSVPAQSVASDIVLVAGGCGIGFHRGPYGGCLRNGVYAPIVVAPYGQVVAPYASPVVVAQCPYGYRIGPYGRCYAY
jgi:hypothetical protein